MDEILITPIFGHRELVQVREVRDGKLWLGGYSIDYDQNRIETGRSEVYWTGCAYYEGAGIDEEGRIVKRPWWKFWKPTPDTPSGQ